MKALIRMLALVISCTSVSAVIAADTDASLVERVVIEDVQNDELQAYLENAVLSYTQDQNQDELSKLFARYPMEPLLDKSSKSHLVYQYVGVPSTVTGLPLTKEQLYSIDFDHAAGITGRAHCTLDDIEKAFPGLQVERALVDIYFPGSKGFNIYTKDNKNPVYSASCTLTPNIEIKSLRRKEGEWGEETPHERLFAVTANDERVVGPYQSRVGVTTYEEVKSEVWEFEGRTGCMPSLDPSENDLYCIRDNIRMKFNIPDEYTGAFEEVPPEVVNKAVLIELLYWPGS